MDRLLEIIRTRELRIVVLAVVLGQAVSSALGSLVHLITAAGSVFWRSHDYAGYESALKATLFMALTNLVLWIVISGGALLLIQRMLGNPDDPA